jgi:autotransporter translocation and assembly factor TamB
LAAPFFHRPGVLSPRRWLHAALLALSLIVGAAAAAVIVSQTAWFKGWLRGYVVRQANQLLNGTVSIERLGGNLFFGVELHNVAISMDGAPAVAVSDLGLDYNVFQILARGPSVKALRLERPVVYLKREGDTWTLSKLVRQQQSEAARTGPSSPVSIEEIAIKDGSVAIEGPTGTSGVELPRQIDGVDAKLSFKYEPVRYSIQIASVSFRAQSPTLTLNALSGGVSVAGDSLFVDKLALRTSESSLSVDGAVQQYLSKPDLKLQITSDKLSIPELARVIPALAGVRLEPAFEIKANGPLDRLGVDMNVRSSAGQLIGRLTVDPRAATQSIVGDLSVRHLDLAPILNDPRQKSDISSDARLNLRADNADPDTVRGDLALLASQVAAAGYLVGPVDAKAHVAGRRVDLTASAAAYGAAATTSGRVMLPDWKVDKARRAVAFDLQGHARDLDFQKLPPRLGVPPAATSVNADYHAAGSVSLGQASRTAVTAQARFGESRVAGAVIADGSSAGVTLQEDGGLDYTADATFSNLDLQRVGQAFQVPALQNDRYATSINAHVAGSGHGTELRTLNARANGELTNTTVIGGRLPRLSFDAAVADDAAHLIVEGAMEDVDPATLAGRRGSRTLTGKAGGDVYVDATMTGVSSGVTLGSVEATMRADLHPSTVGGLEIASATLDGDFRQSAADIRTLDIVGRDINVSADGMLALNDSGQSSLRVHADSPNLATVAGLFEQPVAGTVNMDATVTGNRRQLSASGHLNGSGIKYENDGALSVSSDFTTKVPDLDWASATMSTTSHATFVTVGGQGINDLTARANYASRQVEFDATATQPNRALRAAGSLVLRPGNQEVRLTSLGLQSQGVQWRSADSAQPAIRYDGDTITVSDLRLVSGAGGDQQITVEGTFGRPGDALGITLSNIDVAVVDALLLRKPQLSGRLEGSAKVTGTKADPAVDAAFTVTGGGFRQFKYDSFAGTARYGAKGVDVDARLQQNPSTFLTAKGYAPLAADAPRGEYDLHVDSSPIDLGLVQGFTTAVTNVKGTIQAKVDVTGPAGDPHPQGAVTIEKGSFSVVPTNVQYSGLDGRIDLLPERVHIEQLSLVDNHRAPLSVTGDLAIHEREVGGVSIDVKSHDFKVVDNQLGSVRIDANLRIAGELSAPRIDGDLGVSTGQINLDPILAAVGESTYGTQETAFATSGSSGVEQASSSLRGPLSPGGPFDPLQMYVHITAPNDLVVKASDLRTPGAPIGLGALSATLGGDLYASKSPWDQLRLIGTVNTVRGSYDFQGRRFTILRDGKVRFEGLDDFDAALDIRAERVIQSVTANVNVRGRLRQPELALSSTPPLEDADILSLIVFNQPINQLGEGQQASLASRAQSMALGAAAGQLAQSIGNALSLDTFELNVAPDSGGPPEVTVGQQLGQNLYVKVQQGIGDQSQTNVILEYELTKWLRFRTNVLQGTNMQAQLFQRMQGSGLDLLFFFSY